ncbi:MAG TPA: DUF2934 domain-containing protein [Xanthobacteraceae bacterium]|jgi:hypothetical protein
MQPASFYDRIRNRAYELWIAGGRLDGQADQHWLTAEREVLSLGAGEIASASAAAPARLPRRVRQQENGGARRKKAIKAA